MFAPAAMGTVSYPGSRERREEDAAVSERRRIAAIVLLFLLGFGLIALASSLGATWPLLLTPLPYATIAWIVVHADEDAGTRGTSEAH
jgi:hypothetical protein